MKALPIWTDMNMNLKLMLHRVLSSAGTKKESGMMMTMSGMIKKQVIHVGNYMDNVDKYGRVLCFVSEIRKNYPHTD